MDPFGYLRKKFMAPGYKARPLVARNVSAVGWSPSNLAQLLYCPIVSLMRQQSKLWQDAGQTTLAVNDQDPVYVAQCTFTGIVASAISLATRPTLISLGNGKWALKYTSGSGSTLVATVPGAPQGDASRTLFGAGKRSVGGNNAILAHYGTVPGNNGSFGVNAAASQTYHYRYGNDITSAVITQDTFCRLEFIHTQGTGSVGYVNNSSVGSLLTTAATSGTVFYIGGRTADANYSDEIIVGSGLTGAAIDVATLATLDSYLISLYQ